MLSFENYKSQNDNKLMYILLAIAGGLFLYYFYCQNCDDQPASGAKSSQHSEMSYDDNSGSMDDMASSWNFLSGFATTVEGTQAKDPSNSVQQYDKVYNELDGKYHYVPKPTMKTEDFLNQDELDELIDRAIPRFNKERLDYMTAPSFLRNGDMWFGTHWPHDDKSPLVGGGTCVNYDDIVHPGIFNSQGKFGEHGCGQ